MSEKLTEAIWVIAADVKSIRARLDALESSVGSDLSSRVSALETAVTALLSYEKDCVTALSTGKASTTSSDEDQKAVVS